MTTKRKFLSVLFIVIFFASCKKEKNTSSTSSVSPDDCVTAMSLLQNNIIPGQYIISYSNTVINARNMSKAVLDQLNNDILERNNIDSNALQQSFGGELGGFVAKLS